MKVIKLNAEAKAKIRSGIDQVANAVKLTLGPSGRNAIIGQLYQSPLITNDGITIAKEFELDDELENLGAQMVKEATKSANDISGDGTTTTTVLLQAIMDEGFKRLGKITVKPNPMAVRKEILESCALVVKELMSAKHVRKIKTEQEIANVATVAVENPEIGAMIAKMFKELGKDAMITTQDGFNGKIETETVKGADLDAGLPHKLLSNSTTDDVKYTDSNPAIILTNHPITSIGDLTPLIQREVAKGKKSLILICEQFEYPLYNFILQLKLSGEFTLIPIKAATVSKSYLLEDLAVLLNTQFADKEIVKLSDAQSGSCEKIVISKDKTLFLGTSGDSKERVKKLEEELKVAESLYDKDKLKKRIQKLSGGIGVIRVDGGSDTERGYLKLKIEDAVNATRCALEEGVVKGGGLTLKEIAETMEPNILTEALKAPYNQIQENSGGLEIGNDVVDPVKVTRTCLEKACNIAGLVLTTEIAIADKREKKEDFKLNDEN